MLRRKQGRAVLLALVIFVVRGAAVGVYSQGTASKRNYQFQVRLSPKLSSVAVSGRLLIFMTRDRASLEVVQPSLFELEKVWVAAKEVRNLQPGSSIDFDADSLSYPAPFSTAAPGDYQIMALLDLDHSYSYSQTSERRHVSCVVRSYKLKALVRVTSCDFVDRLVAV